MSNLICKENFNWKKYVDRYKDLKSIADLDTAWNQWCEEGKKQGRKFFTLAPYKNNKYYIITREYIKQKNNKFKNTKSIVISGLDDENVIEDYVSNIKNKLKKLNKNKTFVCQTINQNINDKSNIKQKNNSKSNKNQNNQINNQINKSIIKNDDIEILEKNIKYTEYKKEKEEWSNKTENSEIFFLDFDKNKDDSNESKIYFSKKNSLNVFSNST